jgi:hypothetical protein
MPSETDPPTGPTEPGDPRLEYRYNLNYNRVQQIVLIKALRGFVLDMLAEADSASANGLMDVKDECIRCAVQAQTLAERMDPMHEEPQWPTDRLEPPTNGTKILFIETHFVFRCDGHNCLLEGSPCFTLADFTEYEYELDLSDMVCIGAEELVQRWIQERDAAWYENPSLVTNNYRQEEQVYVDQTTDNCDWQVYLVQRPQ